MEKVITALQEVSQLPALFMHIWSMRLHSVGPLITQPQLMCAGEECTAGEPHRDRQDPLPALRHACMAGVPQGRP